MVQANLLLEHWSPELPQLVGHVAYSTPSVDLALRPAVELCEERSQKALTVVAHHLPYVSSMPLLDQILRSQLE
jgi:hypothetical protein